MTKNINEKNVIEKIIDQTIVVSSGICATIVPCFILSISDGINNPILKNNHKISSGIKNGVNIVNGLSVLHNTIVSQTGQQGINSIDPLVRPLISLLYLSIAANFMLNDNGTDAFYTNKNISPISYAGGMIVGNIIINKFNKGSYDKSIKL